ncbi:MAG: hypothetical protein RIS82_1267 [Actinomycetota bacterium]
MLITKFEHACLVLTEGQDKIIVDPGFYTRPMDAVSGVRAVVITHVHDDHCYEEQLDRIVAVNPGLKVYAPAEVCARLSASRPNLDLTVVMHGDFYPEGEFTLEFFGDLHAEIHRSIPLVQNCGVLVNGKLYYPGDSYTQPDCKVELLACPASAPWLKIGDVMDFIAAVKPTRSFATHNALLSEVGHTLNNSRIQLVTEQGGGKFDYLLPGESTQV